MDRYYSKIAAIIWAVWSAPRLHVIGSKLVGSALDTFLRLVRRFE